MKKVIVKNFVSQEIVSECPAIEDAQAWIDSTYVDYIWGKKERTIPKSEPHEELLVINEFEQEISPEIPAQPIYQYDENGVIVHEDYTYTEERIGQRPIPVLDVNGDAVLEDYTYVDSEGVEVIAQRPVHQLDENGELVLEDYTFTEEITEQRPVVIGETELVPAVSETYVNLKPEYVIEITDISDQYNLEQKLERKIAVGKTIQDLSNKLMFLITGDNMEAERTAEEISQMQTDFAVINALIGAGRLITAKPLIEAIDVVANPQYEELKSDILSLYTLSGF